MTDSCVTCGGLILEPNKNYMYSGKVCHCPVKGQFQMRQSDYNKKMYEELLKAEKQQPKADSVHSSPDEYHYPNSAVTEMLAVWKEKYDELKLFALREGDLNTRLIKENQNLKLIKHSLEKQNDKYRNGPIHKPCRDEIESLKQQLTEANQRWEAFSADKLIEENEAMRKLLVETNEQLKISFHANVCVKTRGCHCKPTAIDKFFGYGEKK